MAKRDSELHIKEAKNNEIDFIDLVCVNLYPFEETLKKDGVSYVEIIENIDIGSGSSMLRSAAKISSLLQLLQIIKIIIWLLMKYLNLEKQNLKQELI